MKKLFLCIFAISFCAQFISAQGSNSIFSIAQQNNIPILDIESSILNDAKSISEKLKGFKEYSMQYPKGTLACKMTPEDFLLFKNNLSLFKNIRDNEYQNLITNAREYLQNYWNLTENDINELNGKYLANNSNPETPLLKLDPETINSDCNLIQVYNFPVSIGNLYKAAIEYFLPVSIASIENEVLPTLALSAIELRIKTPNDIDYTEFPLLNTGGIIGNTTLRAYTIDDIAFCAAAALGVDFMWGVAGLTGNQGVKWTIKAITKAFGIVATRMVGPIGQVIALSSFGYCMWDIYRQ